MKILTPEQIAELQKPLDPKAISKHPTKTFLSTIKAIYVVERLNKVFGIGSWNIKSEIIDNKTSMIVVRATLTIPKYGIELESFGGNNNGGENSKNFDLGDAYKGATTDALTKIGSYLEIGIDVFKGLSDIAPNATQAPMNVPKTKDDKQSTIKKIITMCDNLDTTLIDNKKYNQFIEDKCGVKFSESNFEHIIKTLNELN